MSRRKRRTFTVEQEAQAVRLVHELGSVAKAARDLDLTESSLAKWVKQAAIDTGEVQSGDLTTDERKELDRLRRENRILEQERAFLKKPPRTSPRTRSSRGVRSDRGGARKLCGGIDVPLFGSVL